MAEALEHAHAGALRPEAARELPPSWGPAARLAICIFVGYYVGARLGLALTFLPLPISVLWPPNAIMLGALLVLPVSAWWVVLAAALPAHLLSELPHGIPLSMVLSWYASNIAEALMGAGAVRFLFHVAAPFATMRGVLAFMICAGLAALASSFLDIAFVQANGFATEPYGDLVRRRTLSNMTASLVVAPVIVAWAGNGWPSLHTCRPRELMEAILLAVGLAGVASLAFNVSSTWLAPCAPVPFLLWAAIRFGTRGASIALAAVAIAAIWGAGHGVGILASPSPLETTRSVQVFLLGMGSALLFLAAASEDRQRTHDSLAEARIRLSHVSRLSAMGELSASIAHEISQPMSSILGNVDAAEGLLLKGRLTDAQLREILHDIREDDLRAVEIVKHVRNLARKRAPEVRDFDVVTEVRMALRLVAPLARHRRVALGCRSDGPLLVRGDPVHVQQALVNLILNAMDAMERIPERHRIASVDVTRLPESAQVSVRDAGTGIAPSRLQGIFEPFFTTKSEGSGLGLSITRTLVESQGGRIWAQNNADGGATVSFTIPLGTSTQAHE